MKTLARKTMATKAKKSSPPSRAKTATVRTADHDRALSAYEAALEAFSRKDFTKALAMFEGVIREFPIEREIADRCRIYRGVAKARGGPASPKPKDAEGHYYQGVIEINEGRIDLAAEHLEKAIKLSPEMDKAWYAAAVVCAQRHDRVGVLANLGRAIALNPRQNRICALNEPEFESLREDGEFVALLHKSPGGDV